MMSFGGQPVVRLHVFGARMRQLHQCIHILKTIYTYIYVYIYAHMDVYYKVMINYLGFWRYPVFRQAAQMLKFTKDHVRCLSAAPGKHPSIECPFSMRLYIFSLIVLFFLPKGYVQFLLLYTVLYLKVYIYIYTLYPYIKVY